MAVMIGVVTEGGLFFGGVGATQAEALGSACNVLGEDFELFATLQMETVYDRINASVDEMESADPHLAAPSPAGSGAGGASSGPAPMGAPTPAEGSEAADVRGGRDEGRDGGDRAGEEPTEETPLPGQGSDPTCSVCGVSITEARAEVSIEDYGSPQCRGCSPE